jgi:hypothetical protein
VVKAILRNKITELRKRLRKKYKKKVLAHAKEPPFKILAENVRFILIFLIILVLFAVTGYWCVL